MKSQFRVLHVITRGAGGGTERNLANMIDYEIKAGHEVAVVTGDPKVCFRGATMHRVTSLQRDIHPPRDLRALLAVRSIAKQGRFQVVHTHESKAGILGRLAIKGLPMLAIHSIHMASFGPGYPRALSAIFKRFERLCGRRTDLFASVGSELIDNYVNAGVGPRNKFVLVHSPVDIERFAKSAHLSSAERSSIRAKRGLSDDAIIVSAIGLLERRKRVDLILRELAPYLGSSLQFAIAGDGPERAALELLAQRLRIAPWVHFLGHESHVEELLAVTSVVCHASVAEGVCQALIQAAAAGVPVVATDVEGLGEINATTISIVGRDGEGLSREVLRVINEGPPEPPTQSNCCEWAPDRVQEQIAAFESAWVALAMPDRDSKSSIA